MTRYALVIGIARYDHFRNLSKAAADAEAIAQLLHKHGYDVTRLPRRQVDEDKWEIDPTRRINAVELSNELKDFSKILKAYHRGIFRDLPIPMHKSVSTKNQALQTIPVSKL